MLPELDLPELDPTAASCRLRVHVALPAFYMVRTLQIGIGHCTLHIPHSTTLHLAPPIWPVGRTGPKRTGKHPDPAR